jgi:ABC-2 type transport system permease protein
MQFLRIFKTLLLTYYAEMVEYRAELLLWALSGSLPLILMGVWVQAAQSGSFQLSALQFARYFLAVFLTRQFTVVWVIWEFERDIIEGTLSFRLLQPLDPIWHHIGSHLGERLARLPLVGGLIILFFLLYPAAWWVPSLPALVTYGFVVVCAFILQYLIQYTLAMFAFWTEKATSLQEFSFLMYLFLAGVVAPIEVFPEPFKTIVLLLPYPYLVNFPASVLTGLPINIGQGLFMIGIWSLIFLGINRWFWRKGLRQYSGMGA